MSAPLEKLIDDVMSSGEFAVMQVFSRADGAGYFVSLKRSWTDAYVCDQLQDQGAMPSDHIRHTLESVNVSRKVFVREQNQQKRDFEDLF